jgi:hypothetical protein
MYNDIEMIENLTLEEFKIEYDGYTGGQILLELDEEEDPLKMLVTIAEQQIDEEIAASMLLELDREDKLSGLAEAAEAAEADIAHVTPTRLTTDTSASNVGRGTGGEIYGTGRSILGELESAGAVGGAGAMPLLLSPQQVSFTTPQSQHASQGTGTGNSHMEQRGANNTQDLSQELSQVPITGRTLELNGADSEGEGHAPAGAAPARSFIQGGREEAPNSPRSKRSKGSDSERRQRKSRNNTLRRRKAQNSTFKKRRI